MLLSFMQGEAAKMADFQSIIDFFFAFYHFSLFWGEKVVVVWRSLSPVSCLGGPGFMLTLTLQFTECTFAQAQVNP